MSDQIPERQMAKPNQAISFSSVPSGLVGAWKRKRAIGVVSPAYGSEKVTYGLRPETYTYHKLYRVPLHRIERQGTFWKFTPLVLDYPVELVHSFNELPLGIRPFVVSFENELPRYLGSVKSWQTNIGFGLLATTRCRQILALTEIAAQSLKRNLESLGMPEVTHKVSVFRGAVLTMPTFEKPAEANRSAGSPLRVLFVGRDPFGKGLLPALDALDDCRALGAAIQATIVCNFETRDYISKGRDPDVAALKEKMGRNPDIAHHHLLSNQDIHRLMQSHDVLVFPTLDESLGWVAVEAAMAGMPVIATDIYAIPELVVHNTTGFLIPLRKNETSRWVGLWLDGVEFDQEVAATFATIREHLTQHLLRLVENPSMICSMGLAARMHIEKLYCASDARRQLEEIYAAAIT